MNLKAEQARLEDLYQNIFPFLLQTERALQDVANRGKGPAGGAGSRLRDELAKRGRKLPLLGNDQDTADFQYVKHFLMDDWRILGEKFGLGYCEAFRYIGPPPDYRQNISRYADQHSVPL